MAALTQDRNTPVADGRLYGYPVAAATLLYAGGLACLNAAGFLTKGAVSTTLRTVGVVIAQANNAAGANGDITAEVRRGVFRFGNSSAGDAITLVDVGTDCFIVDDQTVAKTNGGSTRSIAGKVRNVDSAGVWVEI